MPKNWSVTLDHAAIASNQLEPLMKVLSILGLGFTGEEEVASQKVKTKFFKPGNSTTNIELLQPTSSDSTIAKYLEKKGAGIHHLSFMVHGASTSEGTALDSLCSELKRQGIRLIYDAPQPGAHHTRVNFIHPASAGGILIEVSEKAS